jgi:hypothetical protein
MAIHTGGGGNRIKRDYRRESFEFPAQRLQAMAGWSAQLAALPFFLVPSPGLEPGWLLTDGF